MSLEWTLPGRGVCRAHIGGHRLEIVMNFDPPHFLWLYPNYEPRGVLVGRYATVEGAKARGPTDAVNYLRATADEIERAAQPTPPPERGA